MQAVIVTETTARNFWGDADPLGRTLLWEDATLEVVGVVADARLGVLGEIDSYHVYMPRYEGGELLVKCRANFALAVLSSVLFGVSPTDSIGLGRAALLVLGVALAAGVASPLCRRCARIRRRRCATNEL